MYAAVPSHRVCTPAHEPHDHPGAPQVASSIPSSSDHLFKKQNRESQWAVTRPPPRWTSSRRPRQVRLSRFSRDQVIAVYAYSHLSDNIAFMELATGPPADLLLRQCGLLPLPTSGASPLHILDNACGAGIVTQKIMKDPNSLQSHLSVICGDLSPPMLDVAKCRIQAGRWPAEIKTIDVLVRPTIRLRYYVC